MPTYRFSVAVEGQVTFDGFASHWTQLPPADVGEFILSPINQAGPGLRYLAQGSLEAGSKIEAQRLAMAAVEDFLLLLSVDGDLFRVIPPGVNADPVQEDPPVLPAGFGDPSVPFPKTLPPIPEAMIRTGIGLQRRRSSVADEIDAYRFRDAWPTQLRRALELNRLARAAHDDAVSLHLFVSALELLGSWRIGQSPNLLCTPTEGLSRAEAVSEIRSLVGDLRELWAKVDHRDAERLTQRILTTQQVPAADWLHSYVLTVDERVGLDSVKAWWFDRGRIAHGGLTEHCGPGERERLAGTVAAALRKEIGVIRDRLAV